MGWRAVVHGEGACDFAGSHGAGMPPAPRGSLVVETRLAATQAPQTILALTLTQPTHGTLTLKAVPGGGIVLVIARRHEIYHAAVRLDAEARTDILRITYSWDHKGGRGRLAIEWPERQITRWSDTGPAIPIGAQDIQRLGGFFDLREAHPDLIYAALSDIVEPLGPMPTLALETPILTPDGYRCAGRMRRGDCVVEPDGRPPEIVLDAVTRTVPAFGSFAPVRLRAPYFGLTRDIVVAPEQRLLVGGSEVEYTFGCEHVLVPARHLVNGIAAMWADHDGLAQYVQLLLPRHAPVIAAGTVIESLFVGRMRRNEPVRRASLLGGGDPVFLPEQAPAPYRVLSPFEAMTLANRRAA